MPTMLERPTPLWIVTTQGDSVSAICSEAYRRQGVRDSDPTRPTCYCWSGRPIRPLASTIGTPGGKPPRTGQIAGKHSSGQSGSSPNRRSGRSSLNQRVAALGGWITGVTMEACQSPSSSYRPARRRPGSSPPSSTPRMGVCMRSWSRSGSAIGSSPEPTASGRSMICGDVYASCRDRHCCSWVGFKGRLPLAPCETRMVGVNELRLATRSALRAIADRMIAHNGDPELARHVLTAVVAYTGEAGPVLSQRRSPGPITYARALTWCVGATLEVDTRKPAPRVYSGYMTAPQAPPQLGAPLAARLRPPPPGEIGALDGGSCDRCGGAADTRDPGAEHTLYTWPAAEDRRQGRDDPPAVRRTSWGVGRDTCRRRDAGQGYGRYSRARDRLSVILNCRGNAGNTGPSRKSNWLAGAVRTNGRDPAGGGT